MDLSTAVWTLGCLWVLKKVLASRYTNTIMYTLGGSGFKEAITKVYHLKASDHTILEGDRRPLIGLNFTTFNGSITVGPLSEGKYKNDDDDDDGEMMMIHVDIDTRRPEKDARPVVITSSGSLEAESIALSADYPSSTFGGNSVGYSACMRIEISKKLCECVSLSLQTSNARIVLEGDLLLKQLNCSTSNGGIDITADCEAKLNLRTSNGSVDVYSTQVLPTNTVIKSSNGSISATFPQPSLRTDSQHGEVLNFHLRTSNGSVQTNMTHRVLCKKKNKTKLDGICESGPTGLHTRSIYKRAHLATSNGRVKLLTA